MFDYKSFPSKSLLCSTSISGSGTYYPRHYLYGGIDLPPLQSPSLDELDICIDEMHQFHLDASWRNLAGLEKINIIRKSAKLLEANASKFATYDAAETGRSYQSLVKDSYPKAVATIRWFCSAFEVARQNSYNTGNIVDIAYTKRVPYGTCLCILPWNDPLVLFAWKVIPALLLGNPVIVKPSEYSSSSALAYAHLLYESGLPKQALSIVVGRDTNIFNKMITSEKVPAISMTGSTKTALYIQSTLSEAGLLKKLNFECGGKSPFLLSSKNSSESIDKACRTLVSNMFYNQGQICSAPSLLICDYQLVDKAISLILLYSKNYIPGDPFSQTNKVGTMCISNSVNYLRDFLEKARSVGATIFQQQYTKDSHQTFSIPPTILVADKHTYLNNQFLRQELFGPILTLVPASSFAEMIDIGNSSQYGLASSVWTESLEEIQQASLELSAGVLHVNSYGADGLGIPFGGIKNSGEAKEKSLESFDQFSYSKTIYIST